MSIYYGADYKFEAIRPVIEKRKKNIWPFTYKLLFAGAGNGKNYSSEKIIF